MNQLKPFDSSALLQIISFSADADCKTYKIIYRALRGGNIKSLPRVLTVSMPDN